MDKEGRLRVNSLVGVLVGSLAWPCPAPDQRSPSYHPIKSFLTPPLGGGSTHYACVLGGPSAATGVGQPTHLAASLRRDQGEWA